MNRDSSLCQVKGILKWQKDRKVDWHYIAPGKPMQNGFVESFKGRRRSTPSTTARATGIAEYLYDESAGTSSLIREYIWANGTVIGVYENGTLYFVRTDHVGRPVFATDSAGTKVWEASYLPFGGVQASTGPNPALRFPGQWFQTETGLHQNWMRDYDPTTGGYMQADPLGLLDGASLYGYALQNPGRYTDPTGEFIPLLAGATIGLGFGLLDQFLEHGWNYQCFDTKAIAFSTAFGAFGGAAGSALQKAGQARRAYKNGLRQARNRGLSPRQANDLRRGLGERLKRDTPQPFRELIYRWNQQRYGDRLGPRFDPIKFANPDRTLSNTNSLANFAQHIPGRGMTPIGGTAGAMLAPTFENGCTCGE